MQMKIYLLLALQYKQGCSHCKLSPSYEKNDMEIISLPLAKNTHIMMLFQLKSIFQNWEPGEFMEIPEKLYFWGFLCITVQLSVKVFVTLHQLIKLTPNVITSPINIHAVLDFVTICSLWAKNTTTVICMTSITGMIFALQCHQVCNCVTLPQLLQLTHFLLLLSIMQTWRTCIWENQFSGLINYGML